MHEKGVRDGRTGTVGGWGKGNGKERKNDSENLKKERKTSGTQEGKKKE